MAERYQFEMKIPISFAKTTGKSGFSFRTDTGQSSAGKFEENPHAFFGRKISSVPRLVMDLVQFLPGAPGSKHYW
jgi:hypothetical protein